MSNINPSNPQDSANVTPMFPYPPPMMPPSPATASFYQWYMQAAMCALQPHQQQFFQQMFSMPPPAIPNATTSLSNGSNIPSYPTSMAVLPSTSHEATQKRSSGTLILHRWKSMILFRILKMIDPPIHRTVIIPIANARSIHHRHLRVKCIEIH